MCGAVERQSMLDLCPGSCPEIAGSNPVPAAKFTLAFLGFDRENAFWITLGFSHYLIPCFI